MFSAYVTALPSSSLLPGDHAPFANIDGGVVVLVLAWTVALLAAVIVARRRKSDAPSVAIVRRPAPAEKLSAA